MLLLRGSGKGDAAGAPFDVMRARAYVEESLEHLAAFTEVSRDEIGDIVSTMFERD